MMTTKEPFSNLEHLPLDGYNLILADPPWTYRDKANDGQRGASHKYPTMTVEQLCNLPVANLAAKNCLLAMWWTGPMAEEAIAVTKAWGFKLKTMKGFTWAKTCKNGNYHKGMGHYTRANTEDCLFAMKGQITKIRKSRSVSQLIIAQRQEHSRKPDQVHDSLEELVGDVPRLELFARRPKKGWTVWGNQI